MLLQYGWAIPIVLAVVFYKFTLRVFFGMVIIPENKIGLVTKKFVLFGANKKLPDGKIIALNGEPGFQSDTLAPDFIGATGFGNIQLTTLPSLKFLKVK